jgi:hypothetical protein
MKTFHCTHCQSLVFFENVRCLNCDHALAYLPDRNAVAALEERSNGTRVPIGVDPTRAAIRLCANYVRENVCNWALAANDSDAFCVSCRLTQVIPNLSKPNNRLKWYKLEAAKRRMVYALLTLRLPLVGKQVDAAAGLAFQFLENAPLGDARRVLTGHDNGVITVNIDEADDVHREQQRTRQHEAYRTLLGHFRHEIGHYYWDRLIQNSSRIQEFRLIFGDERADYQAALKTHYQNGPPEDWERNFISGYATAHPWEDWAESWAHFLHITDALETARAAGLTLEPMRADEPTLTAPIGPLKSRQSFAQMIDDWSALAHVLNNLNRGLGLPDSYPFVLTSPVIGKLRFVHDTIDASGAFTQASAGHTRS